MSYENLDASELRVERDHWREQVVEYARQFLEAEEAGDGSRMFGLRVCLTNALAHEHLIDRMLKLGAVA
jgi:hypothetical protein